MDSKGRVMLIREVGSTVYVAGSMTAMVVVEPDQMRDAADRTRLRMIKLRRASDETATASWWLSDQVTGGEPPLPDYDIDERHEENLQRWNANH